MGDVGLRVLQAALFLGPVLAVPGLDDPSGPPRYLVLHAAVGALLVSWAVRCARAGRVAVGAGPTGLAVLCLLVLASISVPDCLEPTVSLETLALVAPLALVPLLVTSSSWAASEIPGLVWATLAGAATAGLVAVVRAVLFGVFPGAASSLVALAHVPLAFVALALTASQPARRWMPGLVVLLALHAALGFGSAVRGSPLESDLWKVRTPNTVAMGRQFPWRGVGPGNWLARYGRFHRTTAVDEEYLKGVTRVPPPPALVLWRAETGFAGLAGLALVGAGVLVTIVGAGPRVSRSMLGLALVALVLALAGVAVPASDGLLPLLFGFLVFAGAVEAPGRWRWDIAVRPSRLAFVPAMAVWVTLALLAFDGFRVLASRQRLVARRAAAEDRLEATLAALRACVAWTPRDAQAQMALSEVAGRAFRSEEAIGAAYRAMDVEPSRPAVLAALADLHKLRGEAEAAVQAYQGLLSVDPTATVQRPLAELTMALGRFKDALEPLEKLIRDEPDVAAFRLELARARVGLFRFDEARRGLDELLGRWPDNAEAALLAGQIARRQARLEDAERWLRKAQRGRPHDREIRVQLATILVERNRSSEARMLLSTASSGASTGTTAVTVADTIPVVSVTASIPATRVKGPDDLERSLRDEERMNPFSATIKMALAEVLEKRGQGDEATRLLREAVSLAPGLVGSWLKLATLFATQGKTDQALNVLTIAVTQHPGNPLLLHKKGQILGSLGRSAEALAALELAARGAEAPAAVWLDLGLALARAGKEGQARAALERCLAVSKGDDLSKGRARAELERLSARAVPSARPSPGR